MASVGDKFHPFMSENSNRMLGGSIIPNIVLFIALVSFTPMLIVSGLVLDQFSISHSKNLYAHLQGVVQKHSEDIDSFLNERLKNIQLLSDMECCEDLFNEQFLQEKLTQLQRVYGDVFEDLGIVNEEGVQEFYAGKLKLERALYADAKWFKEALGNDHYISDVFSGLRSSPHFIVSVKRNFQGRDYLLKATINFDAFNSLAENLRLEKTGFAFILNREGKFQTKPHYDMIPSKQSYDDFIKTGEKTKNGMYIGSFKNPSGTGEIIYVAALLKDDDWMLVYQQEKAEAFASLIHAQITAGVVIFLGVLLIVVMNIILFHKVLNRIKQADQEKEEMNRQVIESGKLASVGELAAGIAHEINNPVAIMVQEAGWIEDLLEEEDFEKSKNLEEFTTALKQINTQGKRCKEITQKLLSFARKTSLNEEKVQLNDLIDEIVSIIDVAAYPKVSINLDLDESIPPIFGSQSEIQQVFLNLINNALYVLQKDGGQIDIISRVDGSSVLLVVEDDGPGIPQANLDRIFDPFFTTKPVGKGSGLGLSICFGIIKKMGGEIDVHSLVDEGTRFEVRFPIKDATSQTSKDLPKYSDADENLLPLESKHKHGKRIKLLLVDDEQSFAKVLSKRLERRNMAVTTSLSGTMAIQALRKVDYDVAVLDLKMPDMDGLEVLKIFKTMYPQMEVIILSGHESEKAAREGIQRGAFSYLSKPCDIEKLIKTIRESVAKHQL